jgi:hypothetical protein
MAAWQRKASGQGKNKEKIIESMDFGSAGVS